MKTLIISLLILATASSCWAADNDSAKPNFVFILCDNLGYGDIEPFWDETPHRTPNLNRMAAEGTKFTHFYVTAGVCTPSRSSIQTGCYAQRVGLHKVPVDFHVLRPVSPHGLAPSEITIAESLKKQGYATAIMGKWHLGDQPEFLPTSQGYDYYYGIPYSDDMTARDDWNGRKWPPLPLMENETVVEAPANRDTLTRRYTERAEEWIREHKDEPFFLFFSHAMPGSTKEAFTSDAFRGKSSNGTWGDSVEEIDWSTGKILDLLVELKIDKNTLVIWTSDNGAPNNPGDIKRGTNRPLYGRGYTTAEGGMRVPTIAWQPGRVAAGEVCEEMASTMDLLPTFTRLAGGKEPQDRKIDGKDIAPLIYGEKGAKSPYAAFYYYQLDQLQAVRSGPWKLFLPLEAPNRHPRFKKGPTQQVLFNVVDDLACETDVAADHPDIVAQLTKIADAARADLGDKDLAGAGQRPLGVLDHATARVMKD